MSDVIVRNYQASDIEKLARFFEGYREAFPDAKLAPPEYYTYHPTLAGGQNVFCALDHEERIVGFAPVFPAPATEESEPEEPHHIWTIVLADPGVPNAGQARALLLERVIERAKAIKASFTPHRRVKLAADMTASQRPDIQHLLENGFERYEGMHVMSRKTQDPIPDVPIPQEITVRLWEMASEEDRISYVWAFNSCFFENPKTLEGLSFSLDSPVWAGTAIAAFDPQGGLAGSVLAYPDEEAGWGVVDDVFVLPEWRRRGIARRLVGEGIRYLREQGMQEVRLDVVQSNEPAISLYQSMGYVTINEEVMLGRWLSRGNA